MGFALSCSLRSVCRCATSWATLFLILFNGALPRTPVTFFNLVLSFSAKRKDERKGAGNDKFNLAVRPLHKLYWRYRLSWTSHHFRIALAPLFIIFSINMNIFWVSNGLREFWVKATVLKLAVRAFFKQYCLSEWNERVVLRGQAEKQEPQNYLQPWIFFGYFLCFKTKKVILILDEQKNRSGARRSQIRNQLTQSAVKERTSINFSHFSHFSHFSLYKT